MYVHVSESDLEKVVEGWTPDVPEKAPKQFSEILYNFGVDVNSNDISCSVVQHRNRQDQVVTCRRWTGKERRDEEWLNSGFASWELLVALSDPEVQRDIARMKQNFITINQQNIKDSKPQDEDG